MHFILTRLGIAMNILFPLSLSAQLTLQDSLVAHYPFDGDALDISGNANHGTVVGPVLTTDRFGTPNAAYDFDGVDDYISLLGNQNFYPDLPVTFAAWIKLDTYASRGIFTNDFSSTNFHGVYVNIVNGKVRVDFGDGGPGNSSHRRSKEGSRQLSLGTWYHIAIVMRGALDMDIYVNGKRDCGFYDGTGGPMAFQQNPGRIGHGKGINSPWYNGAIDDVRFYSRELTPDEILFLAASDVAQQDTTICPNQPVVLNAGDGNAIQWAPGTALSCTNCPNPVATPTTTTTYSAFTDNGTGCLDTISLTITVDCAATVDCDTVNLNANFSAVGTNLDVNFTDTSTGTVDSISWDLGDGTVISSTPGLSFSYTYAVADTYTVCLRAYTLFPTGAICADTLCLPVIAEETDPCDTLNLTADFSVNANGLDITLDDLSTGLGIDVLEWDLGDGTMLTTPPGAQFSHTYGMAGLYTICLIARDTLMDGSVCADTLCQPIEVSDILPCDTVNLAADFTYNVVGLNVDFADQSTGDSIFGIAWDFGNGVVTDTAGGQQMFTFPGAGIYNVCLEAVYMEGEIECRDTLCQDVEVRSPDNIRDIIRTWDITSTLNPGIYQITTEQPLLPGTKLEIWTLHGQLLREIPLQQQNSQVDLHPFAQGLYLLRISTLYGAVKVRR